jgi:hypothetical protein
LNEHSYSPIRGKELNIGHAGEHLVMYDLLRHGVKAMLTPEGFNYDILIEAMDRQIKLQVKTTTKFRNMSSAHKVKHYVFNVRRCGKGAKRIYNLKEFDGFALAVLDEGIVGYLSFTEELNKTLLFRSKNVDYANAHFNTKRVPYLCDLSLDNFLHSLNISNIVSPQRDYASAIQP